MCSRYGICGNRHLPRWRTSKKLRNSRGRFDKDRRLTKYFLIVFGVYAVSMIGVNTIWSWAKSLEKTFVVENSRAEEIITNLTWQDEVMSMLKEAGIDVEYASEIIDCESKWNPDNFHVNKGSIDRGLWQINSVHHPEVSMSCSYDPICATRESIRIIKTRGFGEWVCNEIIK